MIADHVVNWSEKLNALKERHKEIASLCEGMKVAYIDIPLHFNVGDHLIYAGTEAFIKNHELKIIYRAFDFNVSHKKLAEADVILLHGGGNFGDIYPRHQTLRENVIASHPTKRIIILPQTIHFSSSAAIDESKQIFKKHIDVHIFVRDKKSFEIAQSFSDKVSLMPDMAHSLHPLIDKSEVENLNVEQPKILNLRRVDVEKVSTQVPITKKSFDWENILSLADYKNYSYVNRLQKFKFLNNRLINNWRIQSESLIFRSINFFSFHNVIYTDRLHGFILAYLLGKNVKLLDNSYGKNSNYYKEWIKDNDLVEVLAVHED